MLLTIASTAAITADALLLLLLCSILHCVTCTTPCPVSLI
jgi:hypothetical protein